MRLAGAKISEVRILLETTSLPLRIIAEETGVPLNSVQSMVHKNAYGGRGWSANAIFDRLGRIVREGTRKRLKPQDARDIVNMYAKRMGDKTVIKEMARKYRVSVQTIYAVIRGEIWYIETTLERKLLDHMK
jgi:hypothetical protein